MPITFKCSCGETLQVPEGAAGRKAFCLRCRKSVPIPEGPEAEAAGATNREVRATDAGKESEAAAAGREAGGGAGAGQCVLVRGENGKDYWKLTCACGKHVRTPAAIDQPYGRCPRCGGLLKLPGYLASRGPVLVSAKPGEGPVGAPSQMEKVVGDVEAAAPTGAGGAGRAVGLPPARKEDETETVAAKVDPAGLRISREAAATAADRLRRTHVVASEKAETAGRISAWPLAGRFARCLAAFVDLTFATSLTGLIVVLAGRRILPEVFLRKEMVVVVVVLAGVLNDGVIHAVCGGSIGKKLVVLVTQTAAGLELGVARALLRGLLKWLLIPGWVVGLVDPSERTLHDLLCNTFVLKGRSRPRVAHSNEPVG